MFAQGDLNMCISQGSCLMFRGLAVSEDLDMTLSLIVYVCRNRKNDTIMYLGFKFDMNRLVTLRSRMLSLGKVLLAIRCRKGGGRASVRVPVTDATLSVDSVSIMQLSATLPTSQRCFTLLSFVSNIPHSSS
jgi:hypothetical protein